METAEIDRSVNRHGKNQKSDEKLKPKKKHRRSEKIVLGEKNKTMKKKKSSRRKPHSLLEKHDADPSDLLDQTVNVANDTISSSSGNTVAQQESNPSQIKICPIQLDAVLVAPLPIKLEPTLPEYTAEFYAQLKFLDSFFKSHQIDYWLNGGTLLGQVRNAELIPWADCNSIGIMEEDGKRCFAELRAAARLLGYCLWNSVHGLKLRTDKSPVTTDIYFYSLQADGEYYLASERSRKQWPKDYFKKEELSFDVAPFGPLMLSIPRDPKRHLATLYGEEFLSMARYSSYNHFAGAARDAPLTLVKL